MAAAKAIGVELPETADPTWGNALYECFDQKVEEQADPAHLYHHAPGGCVASGQAFAQGPAD